MTYRVIYEATRTNHKPSICPRPVNVDRVIAGLPLLVTIDLVSIIAGPHRCETATHNAQLCSDVVAPHATMAEQEAVYQWALQVQTDLGTYGAGAEPNTPYTETLWECLLNVATEARTAFFVQAIATGVSKKLEECLK